MKCKAIQYMRPNGQRVEREFDLPDKYQEQYDSMLAAGCNFAGEELMTGVVSITIENDVCDVDIELSDNNWEKVKAAHIKMLDRSLWQEPGNLVE